MIVVGLVAAASLGFVAGRAGGAPGQQPAAVSPTPARDDTGVVTVGDAALRAELRGVVRAELRDQLARAPAADAPLEPPAPAEPSPAAVQAQADAQALVAQARAARRWADGDVARLGPLIAQLDGAQRHEVLRELADAINRGELHVEAHAPFAPGPR